MAAYTPIREMGSIYLDNRNYIILDFEKFIIVSSPIFSQSKNTPLTFAKDNSWYYSHNNHWNNQCWVYA